MLKRLPVTILKSFYNEEEKKRVKKELSKKMQQLGRTMAVIDDDPTGIQTIRNVYVYTSWEQNWIRKGFHDDPPMFFIQTNSRGLKREEAKRVYLEIGKQLAQISSETKKKLLVFSRSDSTLRGYYPMETECLRKSLEDNMDIRFDGEILIPCFFEGGRYTVDNVHYVREGNELLPVGETEFAKDKTFGYYSSDLREWCAERLEGKIAAEQVTSISLEDLRNLDYKRIEQQLLNVRDFGKVVVNATEYTDLEVFSVALIDAILQGKEFLFRTAASILKVLLEASEGAVAETDIAKERRHYPQKNGVIIVGSHVNKTTMQLMELQKSGLPIQYIEFNQYRVLEENGLSRETKRVVELVENALQNGMNAAVYTKRERLDIPDGTPEQQLEMASEISKALTAVIGLLTVRPAYIIAKGGITSSDVMTRALNIKRGYVSGQIRPGIPIIITGEESKFPGIPYIIFPGNVGDKDTLSEVVKEIFAQKNFI